MMRIYVHASRAHLEAMTVDAQLSLNVARQRGATRVRRVESWLQMDIGGLTIVLFEPADQERFVSSFREFLKEHDNAAAEAAPYKKQEGGCRLLDGGQSSPLEE